MKKLEWWSYRLAMWAQMPGNDFARLWAYWMLTHGWAYSLWFYVIEEPLIWLHCHVFGHIVRADGAGWFCACCLGGSRYQPPPFYKRFR